MLEAYIICGNEIVNLSRVIDKQNKKIKFGSDFFNLFKKQHEKFFGYNFIVEKNVPESSNPGLVKCAKIRLFQKYKSKSDLREKLFENLCVIKTPYCPYHDYFGYVTIYYDVLTDKFRIVNSKSNKLLEFRIANKVSSVDIFKYKSIFQEQTSRDLIKCPNPNK